MGKSRAIRKLISYHSSLYCLLNRHNITATILAPGPTPNTVIVCAARDNGKPEYPVRARDFLVDRSACIHCICARSSAGSQVLCANWLLEPLALSRFSRKNPPARHTEFSLRDKFSATPSTLPFRTLGLVCFSAPHSGRNAPKTKPSAARTRPCGLENDCAGSH